MSQSEELIRSYSQKKYTLFKIQRLQDITNIPNTSLAKIKKKNKKPCVKKKIRLDYILLSMYPWVSVAQVVAQVT